MYSSSGRGSFSTAIICFGSASVTGVAAGHRTTLCVTLRYISSPSLPLLLDEQEERERVQYINTILPKATELEMWTKAAQCECKVDVMNTQRQVEEDGGKLYEHVQGGGKKGVQR